MFPSHDRAGETIGRLFKRIDEELLEARESAQNFWAHVIAQEPREDIEKVRQETLNELADVANFCMMLADRVKGIDGVQT